MKNLSKKLASNVLAKEELNLSGNLGTETVGLTLLSGSCCDLCVHSPTGGYHGFYFK